jgi:4-amino-4-deoxy-L-arabinose transferase-like glycosyltransferase
VNDSRAWRQALGIIAGTTLLRLILGAVVPLFPDETYYWDWSRTLMPGYFDHPPLIAILIRGGTAVFGPHAFGVRFLPIVAGGVAALALALSARELAGDEAGRLAALVFASLPLANLGLVLATPDAPMLAAVACAMYAVIRALLASQASLHPEAVRWWLYAGIAMGLAMASKYTSVLIPFGLAVAFVTHPRLQNKFGERGPYAAVIAATLVFVPVLWWNATHDWVSFRFQLGHGFGQPKGGVLGALNRELQLLGGQVGLVSPILFFFIVRAVKRGFAPTPDGLRLTLSLVATCCIALFVYSASRRSVEANWPALAYIPAIVLFATDPPLTWRGERWLRAGLWLGAALSMVIYVHTIVRILPIPPRQDQVAKAFGWELLAENVDRMRDAIRSRASFGGSDLYVAAERYQDASELAFHLKDRPRVFSLNLTGRANQYDVWETFPERASVGATLLLVLDEEPGEPRVIRKLACCFQRIDARPSVALVRGEAVSARKRVWVLQYWSGEWPRRDQPFPWE